MAHQLLALAGIDDAQLHAQKGFAQLDAMAFLQSGDATHHEAALFGVDLGVDAQVADELDALYGSHGFGRSGVTPMHQDPEPIG